MLLKVFFFLLKRCISALSSLGFFCWNMKVIKTFFKYPRIAKCLNVHNIGKGLRCKTEGPHEVTSKNHQKSHKNCIFHFLLRYRKLHLTGNSKRKFTRFPVNASKLLLPLPACCLVFSIKCSIFEDFSLIYE